MIKVPLSPSRYQEILDGLNEPDLRIKLAPNPTTMGPRYISETIARILAAKSVINTWAEEVERAYTWSQILENNLETEAALRTDEVINGLRPQDIDGFDAAGRKALVRKRVGDGYSLDQVQMAGPGDVPPGPNQLWEDLKLAQNSNIELRALLKMLDRRRDELNKLDSGVRLQQKTIDTEVSIHRSHLPQSAVAHHFENLDSSEPDAIEEDGLEAPVDSVASIANGSQ